MPKAYSYIRFSSVKQQSGDSVERQTRLSQSYALKHSLELDQELNLKDLGISAFDRSNLEKGALGHFLRLVREGRIQKGSYLLVESLDRLSRDKVMDALSIFTDILRAGIIIVTLSDEQVYSYEKSNENWASLIVSIAIMSRANEESAVKSMRVRSSWDAKRKNILKKRLTARCPYWLKPSPGDSGFEFIPERVEIVRRIFQMSRNGVGTGTIVKMLNTEKVPRFSDKTNGWQNSYIQKILCNPAIYGELSLSLQRNGEVTHFDTIPNYYPSIMTKEEWLIAAAARAARRSRGGGTSKGKHLSNLFSGLIRCGYCGGPMNMAGYYKPRAGGKLKIDKYIACSNARRGLGCSFIQWPYPDFEEMVLTFCKAVDFAKVLGVNQDGEAEINSCMRQLESLKLEALELSRKDQGLLNALESLSNIETPLVVIQRLKANEIKMTALEQDKKLVEDQIVLLTNSRLDAAVQQNLIIDLLQHLKTLQGSELHLLRIRLSEAIKRVIIKIITYPGGRWYTARELEDCHAGLALGDIDTEGSSSSTKLIDVPNKQNRHFMIEFQNGEHRTVFPSGRVLDLKTSPKPDWELKTIFENL